MANTSRPAVALHVGAHKTGTTFIQSILHASRDALAAEGVAVVPLETMRRRVTPVSAGQGLETMTIAARTLADVAAGVPSCRRLVLSDENIAGAPAGPRATVALYPQIGARLQAFCGGLLADRATTAFFCLRSYDTLLPSMYSEAVRHTPFRDFGQFLTSFDLASLTWIPAIREIAAAVGEANLVLWDFDTFIANPRQIAAEIAGVAHAVMSEGGRERRPSLSARAVSELVALRRELNDRQIRKRVAQMEKAFPTGVHPANRPFPQEVARVLRERYTAEWDAIRRTLPAARILTRGQRAAGRGDPILRARSRRSNDGIGSP